MSSQQRVSVIAVGVGTYDRASDLEPIPCAAADAERFFHSFERAVGRVLDRTHSLCAVDLDAHEFRTLVEISARHAGQQGNLLVVYFSGHGEPEGNGMALAFADARDDGRDRLTSLELASSTRATRSLVILDCCSAGGALALANQRDPILAPSTSVLASARTYASASFGSRGSDFTLAGRRPAPAPRPAPLGSPTGDEPTSG